MHALTILLPFLLCYAHVVASSVAAEPTGISFVPEEAYTLARTFDLDSPQSLFDVSSLRNEPDTPTFSLKTRPMMVYRPRSPEALQRARVRTLRGEPSEAVEWEEVQVMGPYIEDKHTLSQLARMTGNAYALPGQKNWYDIDVTWNASFPFGWEDSDDGFRGHVFLSPGNATVVLSIKGTTLPFQGPTSKKDKFNDNLLFSCCCARVDLSWTFSQVCGCYAKKWRCDEGCLNKALVEDSLFYNVGVNLVNDLIALYPTSTIWLVGHSLGGSLASLLGATFGLPVVTFEAPGERLAAHRLALPLPPSASVTHVYHNADPIPQGTCTGPLSLCAQGGYALETGCHLGKTIVFDTVGKLGWRVDVLTHRIKTVIVDMLEADVEDGWDSTEDGIQLDVPIAREEVDCMDCYKWEFGNYEDSQCAASTL
ncbi:alpha/beta-hydrolase [Rhodofomes roseus]|uniref:triacylglycerol lipase n=1 Tax=Rhodofomes roseus TaxID=34475 RepID=A0ABQ8KWI7_9APHY|nr:alpha/beta-hydrolase [Rhodofomes roseus]KAH9843196.1 alpha/beta-hydrolase [Rhodofomes roseus]